MVSVVQFLLNHEDIPGTARSRLRALSKLGETYWRSNVVNCGSCLSIRLKTCHTQCQAFQSNPFRCNALHSRYPMLCQVHWHLHMHDSVDTLRVLHAIPGQIVEQMKSLLLLWVPVCFWVMHLARWLNKRNLLLPTCHAKAPELQSSLRDFSLKRTNGRLPLVLHARAPAKELQRG